MRVCRRALIPHIIPAALTAVLPSVRHRACVCLSLGLRVVNLCVVALVPASRVAGLTSCVHVLGKYHIRMTRVRAALACCAVFVRVWAAG